MTTLCTKKFKAAMTLTEVTIAIALVAICIGGIVAVVVQGSSLGKTSEYAYVAANLAKNRIEYIRQIRRDKGYAAVAQTGEADTLINRSGAPDPNGDFKRTTTVNPGYATNLTKVTVSVKYKIRGAFNPVAVELVTLISPYK